MESGGENHPDNERQVRPDVAESAGELVAVEAYASTSPGGCRRAVSFAASCPLLMAFTSILYAHIRTQTT